MVKKKREAEATFSQVRNTMLLGEMVQMVLRSKVQFNFYPNLQSKVSKIEEMQGVTEAASAVASRKVEQGR